MGTDAVALLRIRKLAAPPSRFGKHLVQHRGDASLFHTFVRFGTPPDELALALRQTLGALLDAHDDPRGVLFFPDVAEPKRRSYGALVAELGEAGIWAAMVGADHVPERYAAAEPNSHAELVGRLIEKLGRDEGSALDLVAQVSVGVLEADGTRADMRAELEASLAKVSAALGEPFAERYAASVRREVGVQRAAAAARVRRGQELLASFPKDGAPLLGNIDFDGLLAGLSNKK